MVIIGIKNCPRCKILKRKYPKLKYIEIPRLALGLGDTIAKLTNYLGIKTCSTCRLRQYVLNKWIPYKWRIKQINPKILKAKNLAYKSGITMFPVFANNGLIKIINKPIFFKNNHR